MSDIRLSLCMIVRDEAAMLPGFLAAVAGLWDELIVADTGSVDGSRELVREAGGQVVDFAWRDDFAAARNASLAPARGRWILFLDADERPDAALREALSALVDDDAGAGAATVVMRNELPDGGRREARLLRCFRNDPGIRFRHRIHEDVAEDVAAFLSRARLALRHLPGGVDHLGYVRSTAAARDKKARDTRLLRAALADDPDDLYCRFKLLEVARFWADQELFRDEAEAARLALERTPRARLAGRPWSGELAALVAQALPLRAEAAIAWLDRQARRVEPGPAWHLRRGILLEECGRLPEAEAAYRECLHAVAKPAAGAAAMTATRPLLGLCRLAARRGDAAAAADLAAEAAAGAPRDPEALLAAVCFGRPGALAFAQAHARDHPGSRTAAAQALLIAGRPLDALALLDGGGGDPADAAGILVLALALGIGRDVELGPASPDLDAGLRAWLDALWRTEREDLRDALTERAVLLDGAFPWLGAWLAARDGSLNPSRR